MRSIVALCASLISTSLTPAAHAQGRADLARQVFVAESSFAHTMAARDVRAFASYIAEDAVFFSRGGTLRGKAAVRGGWEQFFVGREAPFSWGPETVEVLESGILAHTSGPVRDPAGRLVGTFNSVWRLEPDGVWRVVFDKGCPVCQSCGGP